MNSATFGVRGLASKSTPRKHIAQAIDGILSGTGSPKTTRELADLTGFDPGEVKGTVMVMANRGILVKVRDCEPSQWMLAGDGPCPRAKSPGYTARAECRVNVVRVLNESSVPMSADDIADRLGSDSGMVRAILLNLRRDGRVRTVGDRPCMWVRVSDPGAIQTELGGWS